ncbi:AAA family ATPase [Methylobacterium sp. 37f]|uniref:AAA family ATPase n=1 Tax=Methylobacterium sp. 37f TaxID=2817058 RepID=UPI001FFC2C5D|nr:AAA family ATPase [Methylobacterium sp. 37f]MCK2055676.1 AAA family ATPase [Methylobacterium sp. 37f]
MKRINVLGNSGSGKSTFARLIGERLQIPVVHLDQLFWEPGWQQADADLFRRRVANALSGETWICEGNYSNRTFDLRVPVADLNIWLETPRLTCAIRILIRSARLKARPDLPAGCAEGDIRNAINLVRYAWRFDAAQRGRVDAELARWVAPNRVVHLRDRNQIAQFLGDL